MPVFQKGDMWSAYPETDLFLITTNSTLQPGNILVMGRDIAKQARERFLDRNKALGQQIAQTCGRNGQYGLLISPRWPQAKIGAFQTKTDVRQPASLFLIQRSTTALKLWAEAHPQAQIHLNFPGTGFGGLLREKVLPIVNQLPDNVTIWEYPDESATPPTPPVEIAWFPDEATAAAMADASERFFALPELSLSTIEQQHHIFAAAFHRGVRYHHDRLAAAAHPLTTRFDRGQKGMWVQGEAVFLEGITDGAAAIQTYREQMNQGEIPVVTGVYTDAVRLLVCQKRQHNGASHEQPDPSQ